MTSGMTSSLIVETTLTLYDVKSDEQQSGDSDNADYGCHDNEQVHDRVIESRLAFPATSMHR